MAAKKSTSVVKPIIKEEGKKNALEVLFEGDPKDLPLLKSVGYAAIGRGNQFVSYMITSRGREIISIEVSEPDMRLIAEESAKTEFVNHFMTQGL